MIQSMPVHTSNPSGVPPNEFPSPVEEETATEQSQAAASDATIRSGIVRSFLDYLQSLIEITRWQLLSAVVLMTLASLSEGMGIAMLFPVLDAAGLNMTNEGHVGHYTAEVRHLLMKLGLPHSLWLAVLLMIFLLLMALRSLFGRAQSVRTMATVLKFEMALSQRLYRAIVDAEWLFLTRSRSSSFTHALTAEMSRVNGATYLFIGSLSSSTLAAVYIALAFKLSAGTTLLVLGAGALLLLISRRWMLAAHESGAALSDNMAAVYAAATEHLQNLKTIKTCDAQGAQLTIFKGLEGAALKESLRNTRSQAAGAFWFEAGSLTVLGAVIFVSLLVLHVGAASLLLLLAIFTRLMPRLATANSQIQAFLADLPAFENIQRMERECLRHAEPRFAELGTGAGKQTGESPAQASELRLDDVCFSYGAHLPLVIDHLSMTLAAGKITAVAGPSGAGKSTIADLVNGLLTPDSGRVVVNGVDVEPQTARAWRSQVGYVGPDTLLFHGSVRANLLWAQRAATEDDLKDALASAAAEFVHTLPRGLDTVIGDRGMLLSNGQRQRIALARALLRKPLLLILDEATNSLDLENEQRILDAIERLKGRATILILGHRVSAARRADTVYIIEHGRVADSGDWTSLAHRSQASSLLWLEQTP
jgi:ATP-binding cassette subfamily C protein